MKSLLFAFVLAVVSAQTRPDMPPPGNPAHIEPAPGAQCAHGPNVPAGSACACKPMCMDGHDSEGNPDGTQWRVEDVIRCRAACHPKHCACTSDCEP